MEDSEFGVILEEIRRFGASARDVTSLQQFAVDVIATRLPHYNWVGFYMLDPANHDVLVLGPFHDAPTEHIRIPVTEGICGAAVARARR